MYLTPDCTVQILCKTKWEIKKNHSLHNTFVEPQQLMVGGREEEENVTYGLSHKHTKTRIILSPYRRFRLDFYNKINFSKAAQGPEHKH